ncbi:MAG: HEAT repeat domain-containing protein [Thermodesulfobacteriota bacterium]
MAYKLLFIVIAGISFSIIAVFVSDVLRRLYMSGIYCRLDEARERYRGIAVAFVNGSEKEKGYTIELLRKKPGAADYAAIEEIFLDALNDADSDGKVRALSAMEALGYVDHYIKAVEKGRAWRRALAAERLGSLRCKRAVPALVSALKSKHFDVRSMAASALGLIKDPSALPHLAFALKESAKHTSKERAALRVVKSALIGFGAEAIPFLTSGMEDADWHVRAHAVDVISEIGDPSAERFLIEALRDSEADVRAKAAKGLGAAGSHVATRFLIPLMDDPSWVVRLHTVRTLGAIAGGIVAEDIGRGIIDSNWQVRRAAAEVLGRAGKDAVPLLCGILFHSNDGYAREQVTEEFQRSGLAGALLGSLSSGDVSVREMAEQALYVMGVHGAISHLITAMDDIDPLVRRRVASILGKVGNPRAKEAIERAEKSDEDLEVRREAEKALTAMILSSTGAGV